MSTLDGSQSMAETTTLLAQARQGDADAFCRVAAAQEGRMYQQAVALCHDLHTAEDLVAETMIEAWRSLGRFNDTCRFSTWLYAILLHRYQKFARRNRSRPVALARIRQTCNPAWPAQDPQREHSLATPVPGPRSQRVSLVEHV